MPNLTFDYTDEVNFVQLASTDTWANRRTDTDADYVRRVPTYDFEIGWGCSTTTNLWYYILRGGVTFDTSTIPDYTTITLARLDYRTSSSAGTNSLPWGSEADVHITAFTPDNYTSIAVADFNNFGDASFGSVAVATADNANQTISIGLNASGIASISKTGYTGFMLRAGADVTGSQPTWQSGGNLILNCVPDNATQKLQLYIEFTYPDAAGFRYRSGGATYSVCTTSTDPGGNRLLLRKGGATYYMPLVAVGHADQSIFAVRSGGTTYRGVLIT